ncbi:hypothetical protein JCM24511_03856 [Saitozyma sp. JCM 24511]|nr:hypothetical protein JCM24511_03856 [Saitozyma sp. JCM 24511]
MSRSRITDAVSPPTSSPARQAPRTRFAPDPSPPRRDPVSASAASDAPERASVASIVPLSSIGNLLSRPYSEYDSDYPASDDEEFVVPPAYRRHDESASSPVHRGGVGAAAGDGKGDAQSEQQARAKRMSKRKSVPVLPVLPANSSLPTHSAHPALPALRSGDRRESVRNVPAQNLQSVMGEVITFRDSASTVDLTAISTPGGGRTSAASNYTTNTTGGPMVEFPFPTPKPSHNLAPSPIPRSPPMPTPASAPAPGPGPGPGPAPIAPPRDPRRAPPGPDPRTRQTPALAQPRPVHPQSQDAAFVPYSPAHTPRMDNRDAQPNVARTPDFTRAPVHSPHPAYPAPTRPTLISPYASPAPSSPAQRPTISIPYTSAPSPSSTASSSHALLPPGALSIALPPPSSPISPLLAMPPSAHSRSPPHSHSIDPILPSSPFATPSSHTRNSSASESIRGYDILTEKRAMFREGQEEIANPFSPRPRMRAKPSGLRKVDGRAMSTVDFWKRFSVMRLDADQGAKESEWLQSTKDNRRWIKRLALGFIALVIIAVAAGLAAHFATSSTSTTKTASASSSASASASASVNTGTSVGAGTKATASASAIASASASASRGA